MDLAVQYTIPVEEAIERIRSGKRPELTKREMITRDVFVVPKEGANKEKIENDIKTNKEYYAEYNTNVYFISKEQFYANHTKMPHGGFVLRSGITPTGNIQIMESSLKYDSNPEATASILLSYARAAVRLNKEGISGAKTVFEVPPYLIDIRPIDSLIEELL